MKLKELIAELEHFNNGHFDEIDDIGDLELSFKLMVKNTDLQDDIYILTRDYLFNRKFLC